MQQSPSRRRYHRRARLLGAQATKDAIVRAARALFAERGFEGTTIEAIAARAEVAPQTVYASFGSKRAIATQMRTLVEREAGIVEVHHQVLGETDARRQLERVASLARQVCEQHGDLYRLFVFAHEPELRAVGGKLLQAQRFGMRQVVESLTRLKALKLGVDPKESVDVLMALASVEMYEKLVTDCGWSPDQFEGWLGSALAQLLLGK